MRRFFILVICLALAGLSQAGERQQLSSAEILATFPGMTLSGNYPDGVMFTETYHPGGTITYRDDRETDTGNWFERGGLFCTFYEKGDGACFAIIKSSANCYEMYVRENEDGKPSELDGNWNSVGWDRNRPATCDLSGKLV